ncbi:MAG: 5-formyltetrahydrofolate cyclo-ligase [Verrucomicrobiales bacterium]|nr:5-formyltetrahydrofolate cyclo-ligase [Verrucomicrobiales bacterium]
MKATLRQEARHRLRAWAASPTTVQQATEALCQNLLAHLQNLPPGRITLFGGLKNEPDLWQLLAPALHTCGWQTALFLTQPDGTMTAHPLEHANEAIRSAFQNWEPGPTASQRPPLQPTHILVPALAFCPETGHRLGRGGGYFDRYLARQPAHIRRIGVGFDCQLLPSLPSESHDLPVQEIFTESSHLTLDRG